MSPKENGGPSCPKTLKVVNLYGVQQWPNGHTIPVMGASKCRILRSWDGAYDRMNRYQVEGGGGGLSCVFVIGSILLYVRPCLKGKYMNNEVCRPYKTIQKD